MSCCACLCCCCPCLPCYKGCPELSWSDEKEEPYKEINKQPAPPEAYNGNDRNVANSGQINGQPIKKTYNSSEFNRSNYAENPLQSIPEELTIRTLKDSENYINLKDDEFERNHDPNDHHNRYVDDSLITEPFPSIIRHDSVRMRESTMSSYRQAPAPEVITVQPQKTSNHDSLKSTSTQPNIIPGYSNPVYINNSEEIMQTWTGNKIEVDQETYTSEVQNNNNTNFLVDKLWVNPGTNVEKNENYNREKVRYSSKTRQRTKSESERVEKAEKFRKKRKVRIRSKSISSVGSSSPSTPSSTESSTSTDSNIYSMSSSEKYKITQPQKIQQPKSIIIQDKSSKTEKIIKDFTNLEETVATLPYVSKDHKAKPEGNRFIPPKPECKWVEVGKHEGRKIRTDITRNPFVWEQDLGVKNAAFEYEESSARERAPALPKSAPVPIASFRKYPSSKGSIGFTPSINLSEMSSILVDDPDQMIFEPNQFNNVHYNQHAKVYSNQQPAPTKRSLNKSKISEKPRLSPIPSNRTSPINRSPKISVISSNNSKITNLSTSPDASMIEKSVYLQQKYGQIKRISPNQNQTHNQSNRSTLTSITDTTFTNNKKPNLGTSRNLNTSIATDTTINRFNPDENLGTVIVMSGHESQRKELDFSSVKLVF